MVINEQKLLANSIVAPILEITNANNVDIIVKIPNICYGCRSKISKCKDCINNDVVPDVRITIPTRGIRPAIKKTVLQLTDS